MHWQIKIYGSFFYRLLFIANTNFTQESTVRYKELSTGKGRSSLRDE